MSCDARSVQAAVTVLTSSGRRAYCGSMTNLSNPAEVEN